MCTCSGRWSKIKDADKVQMTMTFSQSQVTSNSTLTPASFPLINFPLESSLGPTPARGCKPDSCTTCPIRQVPRTARQGCRLLERLRTAGSTVLISAAVCAALHGHVRGGWVAL